MGYLKEKYTKEYFTGFKKEGSNIVYGATVQKDANNNPILREHDVNILSRMNFKDKKVLEFGYGRGEMAKFAIENGAIFYEGVDFSDAAYELALQLKVHSEIKPNFYLGDGLEFVRKIKKEIENGKKPLFDVVMMFDFVEHVPRKELYEIFKDLHDCLSEKAVIVINTPAYKFDNDVIKEGYDKRNDIGCIDLSDTIPETQGMHCNKYSLLSLSKFMKKCGFTNISKAHFFAKNNTNNELSISYEQLWNNYKNKGYSFSGEYIEDIVEYPYEQEVVKKFQFKNGLLQDISIKTTQLYFDLVYKDGNYDTELFDDFIKLPKENLTILDVGGFIGITSLLFAKLSNENSKIITFEPNPYNKNRLLENLSLNPEINKKIQVSDIALSNNNGIIKMLLSSNIDSGYSSTSRVANSHSKISDQNLPDGFVELDVQTETLDNFVERTSIIPNIIKLDIEGAEHLFLLGAYKTIQKYKPILYIEFHSEYCTLKCTQQLMEQGYDIELLKEEADNRILIKAVYKNISKIEENNDQIDNKLERSLIYSQESNKKLQNTIQYLVQQLNYAETSNQKLISLEQTITRIEERVKTSGLKRLIKKIKNKIKKSGDSHNV